MFAAPASKAVQVRRLFGVADDLAVVLVLKVEEKNVLIAGDAGRRRRQRCRRRGRLIKGQADIGGGRVVISGLRRDRAIPVGAGGRQRDRRPGPRRVRSQPAMS
jgi:hypothetical protein